MKKILFSLLVLSIVGCLNEDKNNYLTEQEKVIGDIKFGMTEKEATPLLEEFILSFYDDVGLVGYGEMGLFRFSIRTIEEQYHQGKLYGIKIRSRFGKDKLMLKETAISLKDFISTKYDKPNYEKSIPSDYEYWSEKIYGWSIGSKEITISFFVDEFVELRIFQSEIDDEVKIKLQKENNLKKIKEEKENAKKAEKIL